MICASGQRDTHGDVARRFFSARAHSPRQITDGRLLLSARFPQPLAISISLLYVAPGDNKVTLAAPIFFPEWAFENRATVVGIHAWRGSALPDITPTIIQRDQGIGRPGRSPETVRRLRKRQVCGHRS